MEAAIHATMVRLLAPGVSLEEKQLLRQVLSDYILLLRDNSQRQLVLDAIAFCDESNGFLRAGSVDILWDAQGRLVHSRMNRGLDAGGILALGAALLPVALLLPAALPVLAALEGAEALMFGAAAGMAVAGIADEEEQDHALALRLALYESDDEDAESDDEEAQ